MREPGKPTRILALGGSLREASKNRALLDESAALAPDGAELDLSQVAVIGCFPCSTRTSWRATAFRPPPQS